MVNLSFLHDDEDSEEDVLNLPMARSNANKFKTRKLNRNNIKAAQPATSRVELPYDQDENDDDLVDLDIKKLTKISSISKRIRPVKERTNFSHVEQPIGESTSKGKAQNMEEYLKSYGEVDDSNSVIEKRKLHHKAVSEESGDCVEGEEMEGIVIEGSDIEESDLDQLKHQDSNRETIASTNDVEKTRRREILEALGSIVSSELDSDQNQNQDQHHNADIILQDQPKIIELPSETAIREAGKHTNVDNRIGNVLLVSKRTNSFSEELDSIKSKIGSLTDMLVKHNVELSHLQSEHDKLKEQRDRYATDMTQAFRLSR